MTRHNKHQWLALYEDGDRVIYEEWITSVSLPAAFRQAQYLNYERHGLRDCVLVSLQRDDMIVKY